MRKLIEAIESVTNQPEPWEDRDARGWQLYSDMKGVGKAARALNAAMRAARKELFKGGLKRPYDSERWEKAALDVYKKHLKDVLWNNREFGAMDTEPLYVARHGLIDPLEAFYGHEAYRLTDVLP